MLGEINSYDPSEHNVDARNEYVISNIVKELYFSLSIVLDEVAIHKTYEKVFMKSLTTDWKNLLHNS